MYVVMGATGHVGAAVANALLAQGEPVTILTRRPEDAGSWREKGASVAMADAENVASLTAAFRQGKRAFLLNPPADPTGDTDATELRTVRNILIALEGSNLEKVVAASTYGAQPGKAIGDLTTLWALEEGLRTRAIPTAVNRGAYYMSNWTGLANLVQQSGKLPSLFPADALMPMVAPVDLGEAAASHLRAPAGATAVHHIEGPARYTPQDVANAFASALGREVIVEVVPRDQWEAVYKDWGFSDAAARAYVRMTEASLADGFYKPDTPQRGRVTLQDFIAAAMKR
ncbi:MAG: NmrA family NAD(P)-binding protein [Pseudomonadota bacterium]